MHSHAQWMSVGAQFCNVLAGLNAGVTACQGVQVIPRSLYIILQTLYSVEFQPNASASPGSGGVHCWAGRAWLEVQVPPPNCAFIFTVPWRTAFGASNYATAQVTKVPLGARWRWEAGWEA